MNIEHIIIQTLIDSPVKSDWLLWHFVVQFIDILFMASQPLLVHPFEYPIFNHCHQPTSELISKCNKHEIIQSYRVSPTNQPKILKLVNQATFGIQCVLLFNLSHKLQWLWIADSGYTERIEMSKSNHFLFAFPFFCFPEILFEFGLTFGSGFICLNNFYSAFSIWFSNSIKFFIFPVRGGMIQRSRITLSKRSVMNKIEGPKKGKERKGFANDNNKEWNGMETRKPNKNDGHALKFSIYSFRNHR